jgi:tetratricopeptide (TPR) repeat protein
MANLVPTLTTLALQAEALHDLGQLPKARRAYEQLVQRAQEEGDRRTEALARAMLSRCLLRLRDVDGAREQLGLAAPLDPADTEGHARYRGARVRLAMEEGPPDVAQQELVSYLRWAEEAGLVPAVLDACSLTVPVLGPEVGIRWLERGLERVQASGGAPTTAQARVGAALAAALDQAGESERALAAYQAAHEWHLAAAPDGGREAMATGWAVGSIACRLEDWPLARTALEDAIALGQAAADCDDLIALALADLATVYEAAGDVIEARRLMIRAVARGREQQLAAVWPERWARMLEDARRLELD